MVQAENKALGVAVAGSVVAHLVVFLLAALYTAFPIFAWDLTEEPGRANEVAIDQMTIILPPPAAEEVAGSPEVKPDEDGYVPAPEVPLPEPEEEKKSPRNYIRTTQNQPESAPPAEADFVSDRDTTAASELPPAADGTEPVPTQDGREDLPGIELKDRDYRDGEIKEDEARPTVESPASPAAPPQSPDPIAVELQKPEEPAKPGERNSATDPDATGPERESPPLTPGEGAADQGIGEVEAPAVRIESAEVAPDPVEMEVEEPLPPDFSEAEVEPTPLEASIPPPASFEELLGGEDTFPLPLSTDLTPTPDAVDFVEPLVTKLTPPSEAAAPMPEIRRPEVIIPADPVLPLSPAVPTPPSVPLPGDPDSATADAFQPHTRKQKMSGTISNRGPAAVDAEATAVGRYTRMVTGNIERRWNILRSQKADYVTYGNMRIRFDVNAEGRTQNVRILSNDANPIMADFTLAAIIGSKAEPMPPDVVSELALANGLLEITYNVIIY